MVADVGVTTIWFARGPVSWTPGPSMTGATTVAPMVNAVRAMAATTRAARGAEGW